MRRPGLSAGGWRLPASAALLVSTLGCADGSAGPAEVQLSLELVAAGLNDPVYVTAPPGDFSRLFVVEQRGVIRILRDGVLLSTPFLDIRSRVLSGGERGLLSMAFHPEYAQNGEFFVYYTEITGGHTRVARYRVLNPNAADPASEEILLAVNQPAANHNGGLIVFGPDQMLYIGLGDGGGSGDIFGNGQDSTTLLGSILRIDVDAPAPYGIPPDNPFVSDPAAAKEIWVYGLRNPWRFSFDRARGDLYIGDVGQNEWEEIDVQPAGSPGGENYGWNVMEGAHCFNPPSGCDATGLVLPALEYARSGGNCSVIGGYVYRGPTIPSLVGHYLYSDYCSGFVRSFRLQAGQVTEPRDRSAELQPEGRVTSFGEDARGELYITTEQGNVFRIVAGS